MGALLGTRIEHEELGEPVGTLEVESSPRLVGTTIDADELPLVIDEVPVLAIVAAHASGQTRFRGGAELRLKESDRLGGLAEAIRGARGAAELEGDDLIVGGGGLAGGEVDARGTIAWPWRRRARGARAGLGPWDRCGGGVLPRVRTLAGLARGEDRGLGVTTVIAIDGAAGTGKSTLAQRLAAELGLPYVNTRADVSGARAPCPSRGRVERGRLRARTFGAFAELRARRVFDRPSSGSTVSLPRPPSRPPRSSRACLRCRVTLRSAPCSAGSSVASQRAAP